MDILQQMEKVAKQTIEITKAQLWSVIIVVTGSVLMFWMNTNVRISALEIRVANQELFRDQVVNKLDKLQEGINDVRLTLRDKQDRK